MIRSPLPWLHAMQMLVAPHFPKGQGFDIPVVCVCVCVCARACVCDEGGGVIKELVFFFLEKA